MLTLKEQVSNKEQVFESPDSVKCPQHVFFISNTNVSKFKSSSTERFLWYSMEAPRTPKFKISKSPSLSISLMLGMSEETT